MPPIGPSGNQTYFLHDGLGSTVALIDGSGNVTTTYDYDAFGATRSQTGPASTPWQFTGQQLDAESSLSFLRATITRAPDGLPSPSLVVKGRG